uniref:Uncharacterized protein n=1 Tax=Plectus sambesii TaxID=2011161 RepID=A0A914W1P7_9BILA
MGLCESAELRYQREQNDSIEKFLQTSGKKSAATQKLLLLGAAECGKSTVLKQMRIIHDSGFSKNECESIRTIIRRNILEGMHTMLLQIESLGIVPTSKDTQRYAKIVLEKIMTEEENFEEVEFSSNVTMALKNLWQDQAVQACFNRRSEYHLTDSIKYYLNDLDRIADQHYAPTNQDVLYARARTSGIVETAFTTQKTMFRVFDVGGQRSERRKWIHCFDNVNAIIFICAVSEFNQKLMENDETNRLLESLEIFKQIVNNTLFSFKCSMILFLNKTDLFAEKIKVASITAAFPNYKGATTYEAQLNYIQKRFESCKANPKKIIYTHRTCATDTNQVETVLDDVLDQIVRLNLLEAGVA